MSRPKPSSLYAYTPGHFPRRVLIDNEPNATAPPRDPSPPAAERLDRRDKLLLTASAPVPIVALSSAMPHSDVTKAESAALETVSGRSLSPPFQAGLPRAQEILNLR
jgi:hypothetical protein